MPTVPLPESASLEDLAGQAELVRNLVRSGDAGALAMVDEFHPRLRAASLTGDDRSRFENADSQLVVARLYGFAGWQQLRAHLGVVADHIFTPLPENADLSPTDAFVVAACLDYAEHGPRPQVRIAEAHRMLAAASALAAGSIAAIAAVGDHVGLAGALDRNPEVANAPCGPNQWPPLLYATYSRIAVDDPAWSAVETVRVLLERGADPNAGFLWRGLVPPFTALTGALGGGESAQPWRPERLEIARLLLEAGADPNDGQGLYNNGIGGHNDDDPAHLRLLVEYGLGAPQDGPWYRLLGDRLRDPAELLYDEVEAAAKRNRPAVLRYLLGLGLDPTRAVGRSQLPAARIAAAEGHEPILDVLAEHDVDVERTPLEEALRAIRTNDVDALGAVVRERPTVLDQLRGDHGDACRLVGNADGDGGSQMLMHLMELGFDVNDRSTTKTPLHHAAEAGDLGQARLLVEHGADPNLCDTHIGATPLGWADHGDNVEAAAYLRPLTHPDGVLPEITVVARQARKTLATPALIDARLEMIDEEGVPVLVTLRHGNVALTLGLGHPDVSVALFLDRDGIAWFATSAEPRSDHGEVEWTSASGEKRFDPAALLSKGTARALAGAFLAEPGDKPAGVAWRREGHAIGADDQGRAT